MKTEKSPNSLHAIAVKVAKNIHRMSDAEHGRSIDKFGAVSNYVGSMDEVGIEINEDTRITVHNHVSQFKTQTTFSEYDVYNFVAKKQLIEIIVCCYGYYYYLRRGSYKGTAYHIRTVVKSIYDTIPDKVSKEYYKNRASPDKSLKVMTIELNRRIGEEIHKSLHSHLVTKGLIYGRCKL